MSISQEELKKIAEKLSKIPGDNKALLGNITDIVAYMDLLSGVNTQGIIPTVSVVEGHCQLRDDTIASPTGTNSVELLACSKQKVVANQVVLPNIMN